MKTIIKLFQHHKVQVCGESKFWMDSNEENLSE